MRTAFPREAVLALLKMTSQQQVVLVTSKGLAAGLPGHQLPDSVQQPGGTPIGDLLRLPADQRLVGALSLDGLEGYLCLATRLGTVKRLALGDLAGLTRDFSEIMGGLGDDEVVGLVCTDGKADLLLASAQGKAIRFAEDTVRAQGLGASGMKGMDLKDNDTVVGIAALTGQTQVVIASERGFAKRSRSAEYTAQGRGGQGAATMGQSKLAVWCTGGRGGRERRRCHRVGHRSGGERAARRARCARHGQGQLGAHRDAHRPQRAGRACQERSGDDAGGCAPRRWPAHRRRRPGCARARAARSFRGAAQTPRRAQEAGLGRRRGPERERRAQGKAPAPHGHHQGRATRHAGGRAGGQAQAPLDARQTTGAARG